VFACNHSNTVPHPGTVRSIITSSRYLNQTPRTHRCDLWYKLICALSVLGRTAVTGPLAFPVSFP
jgi:hypothetical protein